MAATIEAAATAAVVMPAAVEVAPVEMALVGQQWRWQQQQQSPVEVAAAAAVSSRGGAA